MERLKGRRLASSEQLIAAEQDRAFAKGACVVNCGFYTVGQVAIVEP